MISYCSRCPWQRCWQRSFERKAGHWAVTYVWCHFLNVGGASGRVRQPICLNCVLKHHYGDRSTSCHSYSHRGACLIWSPNGWCESGRRRCLLYPQSFAEMWILEWGSGWTPWRFSVQLITLINSHSVAEARWCLIELKTFMNHQRLLSSGICGEMSRVKCLT